MSAAPAGPGAFRLASTTPPAWARFVARDVPALLSDHAHLELKAAASAMTLLRRQATRPLFALRLIPLIREETEHCQRVLKELHERGEALRPDRPSPYAAGLIAAAGSPRRRLDGLVDTALVAALIELRSHERFACLLACEELAALHPLYRGLAEAEARHGELFLELALSAAPADAVAARFAGLARAEAGLLDRVPAEARIHGGMPPGGGEGGG